MNVSLNIPISIEDQFRKAFGPDLSEFAREALLINGYRTGCISLGFVAEVLGLPTRFDAQKWLAARGVPLNYDLAELDVDRETLRKYFDVLRILYGRVVIPPTVQKELTQLPKSHAFSEPTPQGVAPRTFDSRDCRLVERLGSSSAFETTPRGMGSARINPPNTSC